MADQHHKDRKQSIRRPQPRYEDALPDVDDRLDGEALARSQIEFPDGIILEGISGMQMRFSELTAQHTKTEPGEWGIWKPQSDELEFLGLLLRAAYASRGTTYDVDDMLADRTVTESLQEVSIPHGPWTANQVGPNRIVCKREPRIDNDSSSDEGKSYPTDFDIDPEDPKPPATRRGRSRSQKAAGHSTTEKGKRRLASPIKVPTLSTEDLIAPSPIRNPKSPTKSARRLAHPREKSSAATSTPRQSPTRHRSVHRHRLPAESDSYAAFEQRTGGSRTSRAENSDVPPRSPTRRHRHRHSSGRPGSLARSSEYAAASPSAQSPASGRRPGRAPPPASIVEDEEAKERLRQRFDPKRPSVRTVPYAGSQFPGSAYEHPGSSAASGSQLSYHSYR